MSNVLATVLISADLRRMFQLACSFLLICVECFSYCAHFCSHHLTSVQISSHQLRSAQISSDQLRSAQPTCLDLTRHLFPKQRRHDWGGVLTCFEKASCPPACQATPPDRYLPSSGHPAAIRRPSGGHPAAIRGPVSQLLCVECLSYCAHFC